MPIFNVGLRTIKTGVAVAISIYLSAFIPNSVPLLSGIAALFCMQPSISAGLKNGAVRIKATILGGIVGLTFLFVFGSSYLMLAIAVILAIHLSNVVKWQEGLALAALTVIAIMLRVPSDAALYAVAQISSALIGIVVATAINVLIAKPKHSLAFRRELNKITVNFPALYSDVVTAFWEGGEKEITAVKDNIKKTEADFENLRREFVYIEEERSSYRIGSETIELQEYLLFEKIMIYSDDIMAKLDDILKVAHRLQSFRQESGFDLKTVTGLESLVVALREMAKMLGDLHGCVFSLVGEKSDNLLPVARKQAKDIYAYKERVRQRLKYWEVEYIQQPDMVLLMSVHRVVFDLEEIANNLLELAEATVTYAGLGQGEKDFSIIEEEI